ncbi:MAG: PLP-dependent aminotransferase family protein [Clostridia bacterium]|nr:PLP-dependent aminotransferase family protein [Clostridia bacterium]
MNEQGENGDTMFSGKIDEHAPISLGEQVYRLLVSEIEAGHIRAGEKLPSRRELAEELKVSSTTIEGALDQLVAEGICESRPRSGLYVLSPEQIPHRKKDALSIRWDFGIGAMDTAQFPYSSWAKLMRIVLSEQSAEFLRSGDPQGSPDLRKEIAGMILRMRGMEVAPDQIVVAAGTDSLVTMLITLIGRERLFAVEDPGYSRARRILIAGGARIAPVQLRDGAIDVRELYLSGAGAAYVTPGRQFPTGKEMPETCRERLLMWARETGAYILEDDYENEFFMGDRALPLMAMDSHEHVIYMNTFARTLAPGLRISYMILPRALCARYRELYGACSVPGFDQATLMKFLEGGYYDRHVKRMRTIYRQRIHSFETAVAELDLGELIGNRGLFELLKVKSSLEPSRLVPTAREAGVYLTSLSDYCITPSAENDRIVLLGLAGMDEPAIREGLSALASVWKVKS